MGLDVQNGSLEHDKRTAMRQDPSLGIWSAFSRLACLRYCPIDICTKNRKMYLELPTPPHSKIQSKCSNTIRKDRFFDWTKTCFINFIIM